MFDFRSPMHLLNDPEMIKHLTVKEFDHFTDHSIFMDETMDPFFGNSLLTMKGQKWRDMRATLSPAFTGSKMRLMFELVVSVTEQMVEHMRKKADEKGLLEYEMKDVCSRYMNDIIALCAFGVTVNSFENPTNEFMTSGKKLVDFNNPMGFAKFFGFRIFPELMKMAKIQFFDSKTRGFFKDLILSTMDYRKKNNITRPDMVNLLMEVREGKSIRSDHDEKDNAGFATVQESDVGKASHKREWSDDELIAQCFLFFLAGFDTSSTLMSFASYEIMINEDVQERLYQELKDHHESEGKLTYESLQKLKYLDMVVSETLRKWPPFPMIDRRCTKTLDYDDNQGFKYTFEKGTILWLNICGIHNNPKYFSDPRKFDPERFSEENKHLINPDAYLPFGSGPRNCIGSRFALMEVKCILYYLVLNFKLVPIEKTQIPLQLKTTLGALMARDGIWVGFNKRK